MFQVKCSELCTYAAGHDKAEEKEEIDASLANSFPF